MSVQKRITQLDAIRAVAILLVLLNHLNLEGLENRVLLTFFNRFRIAGWIGVDLFFVLSGFLIGGLLFDEYKRTNNIDVKRFLIRRGFKIYPSYFVFLIIGTLINFLLGVQNDYIGLFYNAIFIQNYFPRIYDHTWSLAIEEHFYILLPFLLLFLLKRPQFGKNLFWTFLIIGVVCLGLRFINVISPPEAYNFHALFGRTHLRFDSLFFGVFLCYIYKYYKEQMLQFLKQYQYTLAILSSIVITTPFIFARENNFWLSSLPLTLLYLAFGFVLIWFLQTKENVFTSALGVIGTYSYSIYLFHPLVNELWKDFFFKTLAGTNWYLYFSGYVFLSIGIGILIFKMIENPSLRLRNKLFPAKT
ncbi:acyltransferase [Pedobacter sp. SYSU D00535]|uniref:acyltransferase family protein n=1 Tax=Pedobacter sp. SYSU D00535 TaxID=2810308 RepID=UPI001A97BD25|nr:acyltransferase [Pedobacter sp. SYSU D00535]